MAKYLSLSLQTKKKSCIKDPWGGGVTYLGSIVFLVRWWATQWWLLRSHLIGLLIKRSLLRRSMRGGVPTHSRLCENLRHYRGGVAWRLTTSCLEVLGEDACSERARDYPKEEEGEPESERRRDSGWWFFSVFLMYIFSFYNILTTVWILV